MGVYEQFFQLFIFTITGMVIGILFDVFRIIRKSFKTADFITYIEDVLFWILTGLILLLTIFTFNNGEIRLYIFVGLLLGSTIYLLTISKYIIKICVIILNFIKKILYLPIKTFINFIKKFIIAPISQMIQKIKVKFTKWIKNPVKNTRNPNFRNICDKN